MSPPERHHRRLHLNLHLPHVDLTFGASPVVKPAKRLAQALPSLRRRPRTAVRSQRTATRRERSKHRGEKRLPAMSRTARIFWHLIARGTRPGEAGGLLLAWTRWENVARALWPAQAVPGAPYGVFHVRRIRYSGEPLRLRDGSEVVPGAAIMELHCDNAKCLEITRAGRIVPCAAAREELRALARFVDSSEELREVRALYGFTLLEIFAARLGFMVMECTPSVGHRFQRIFMRGLLLIYTPDGLSRLDRGRTVNSFPYHIWMSRDELIGRYGEKARASAHQGPLAS